MIKPDQEPVPLDSTPAEQAAWPSAQAFNHALIETLGTGALIVDCAWYPPADSEDDSVIVSTSPTLGEAEYEVFQDVLKTAHVDENDVESFPATRRLREDVYPGYLLGDDGETKTDVYVTLKTSTLVGDSGVETCDHTLTVGLEPPEWYEARVEADMYGMTTSYAKKNKHTRPPIPRHIPATMPANPDEQSRPSRTA